MKKIKFRIWDKKLHVIWQAISLNKLLHYLIFQSMPNSDAYCALKDHFDEMIWEQYIGLKDKNDKEIFNGDIVECVKQIHPDSRGSKEEIYNSIVERDTINPCFVLHRIIERCKDDIEYDFVFCQMLSLKIIGNIHENPELLKNK